MLVNAFKAVGLSFRNFLSFGEAVFNMLCSCACDAIQNNAKNSIEIRLHIFAICYAVTFSSCASSASNSRRLGLISRGLPQ